MHICPIIGQASFLLFSLEQKVIKWFHELLKEYTKTRLIPTFFFNFRIKKGFHEIT